MKKLLILILGLTVSTWTAVIAEEKVETSSENYQLDADKISAYQVKESAEQLSEAAETVIEAVSEEKNTPKIITEKTKTGRIEKLLNEQNQIIAEKTIENDKIIKKVLNYYYPGGQLMRQVTANDEEGSFYAEEYYTNGKISSQAAYINENNKIGKEKRYDANGVLRQEITWILPKEEKEKPVEQRHSIRQGNLITYYPDGKMAASFAVGANGKTTFFDYRGFPIKEIQDAQILDFSKDISEADCKGVSIHLGLEELVELYEDEGDISYNKCGFPYRENFVYEVVKKSGLRETRISYDEIGMIRKITHYKDGFKDGTERKYDASGNLTAEISYKNGLKNGHATGYFPTKDVAFRKRYENGQVADKLTCYFPTGEIAAEFTYKDGLKDGTAVINSPVKREIKFVKGEMIEENKPKETRQMISLLSALPAIDEQCLNMEDKLQTITQNIDANINSINNTFTIDYPKECIDASRVSIEKNKLVCRDILKRVRSVKPLVYNRGEYVTENVYMPSGRLIYDIAYKDKKRQGWSKKYNEQGTVIAEIYFDQGEMTDSARSYYANGVVKEMITFSDDNPYKVLVKYNDKGQVEFSLNYKDGEKQEAYIRQEKEGKSIIVRYYKDKQDSIRESNLKDPNNFIEYNLALGEYTLYRNDELIKGGKICGENKTEDIKVINLKRAEAPKENTIGIESELLVLPQENTENNIDREDESLVLPTPASTEDENTLKTEETYKEMSEDETRLHKISEIISMLPEDQLAVPPVISEENAPIVDDIQKTEENNQPNKAEKESVKLNQFESEMLSSEKDDNKQAEVSAQNIEAVTKPKIEDLSTSVQKETITKETEYVPENTDVEKTEKLYYPNGNLRKTVKTKGQRTQEIKEYSKNGLLLTDTVYGDDKIVVEKYSGSGEVRRKTEKSYENNPVNAFIAREDYYDDGNLRYEVKRQPLTMLFSEKTYNPDKSLKTEIKQTGPLTFNVKEYGATGSVVSEDNIPSSSRITAGNNIQTLKEYGVNSQVKTEVVYYDNGEISVKAFNQDGSLSKFAYLAPDGTLHIEKPTMKVIPAYRERYWVNYNNPKWVENQDKYSIKSIAVLNLDIVSKILTELELPVPAMIKELKEKY